MIFNTSFHTCVYCIYIYARDSYIWVWKNSTMGYIHSHCLQHHSECGWILYGKEDCGFLVFRVTKKNLNWSIQTYIDCLTFSVVNFYSFYSELFSHSVIYFKKISLYVSIHHFVTSLILKTIKWFSQFHYA